MAVLWDMLPETSRTARRQRPELRWSQTDYLLWRIEHQLRLISWGMSDAKKRSPQEPRPLKTPAQLAEAERHKERALANKEEIDRILGMEAPDGEQRD